MDLPGYEFREKVADALVHTIAVLTAIVGVSILLVMTALKGDGSAMIAGAIFGCGLLASFTMSAAHDIVDIKAWKAVLKRADHAAIYLLIASAYTPFAWIVVGGQIGFALLAFVWIAAIVGVVLNVALPESFRKAPVVLFLMIGWALIGAADSLLTNLSKPGLYMLITCAWLFSIGLLFLRWEALPFQNAIWRIFVLVATGCLYTAVFIELTAP